MKSLRLDVIVRGLEGGRYGYTPTKKNGQHCLADFSNNKSILHLSEDQRSLYVQEQVANMLLQTSETSFLGLGEGNLKPERRKKKKPHRFKLM